MPGCACGIPGCIPPGCGENAIILRGGYRRACAGYNVVPSVWRGQHCTGGNCNAIRECLISSYIAQRRCRCLTSMSADVLLFLAEREYSPRWCHCPTRPPLDLECCQPSADLYFGKFMSPIRREAPEQSAKSRVLNPEASLVEKVVRKCSRRGGF